MLDETWLLIKARYSNGALDIEDIETLRAFLYELQLEYRRNRLKALQKQREEI